MSEAKCDALAKKYPNTEIIQLQGGFYNAYDDCAIVLSSVMNYKLNETDTGRLKAGFPIGSAEKVIRQLKQIHINYIMLDGNEIVGNMVFDDNRFSDFCDKSRMPEKPKVTARPEPTVKEEKVDTLPVAEIESSELLFLSLLCDGKDPFSGEATETLNLNDVRTVRTLYRIRDIVKEWLKQ